MSCIKAKIMEQQVGYKLDLQHNSVSETYNKLVKAWLTMVWREPRERSTNGNSNPMEPRAIQPISHEVENCPADPYTINIYLYTNWTSRRETERKKFTGLHES